MKIIAGFLLLFFVSTAFASNLQTLNQQYRQKQYKAAYQGGLTYLRRNPLNVNAQLLVADSAFKLGYLDEAMAAYDRVLILAPDNVYAKVQEAKLNAEYGHYDLSLLGLNSLLKQDLPPKQKQKIVQLINEIKQKRLQNNHEVPATTAIKARLNAGILFDSNANADIGEKSIKIPAYNLNYFGSATKKKFAAFVSANANKHVRLDKQYGLWAALGAYNKNYINSAETRDLSYLFASAMPYYQMRDYKISLPVSFNKVLLNYASYLHVYGMGINVKTPINQGAVEGGYNYSIHRFSAKDEDKDANNHRLYAGLTQNVFEHSQVFLRANYAYNQEKRDLRTDVNYNAYGVRLGVNHKLQQKLTVKGSLAFNSYFYSDYNPVFLNKRVDKSYQFNLGLTYGVANNASVNLDLNYLTKSSNQFLYDYNKLLIPLSYSYRF